MSFSINKLFLTLSQSLIKPLFSCFKKRHPEDISGLHNHSFLAVGFGAFSLLPSGVTLLGHRLAIFIRCVWDFLKGVKLVCVSDACLLPARQRAGCQS